MSQLLKLDNTSFCKPHPALRAGKKYKTAICFIALWPIANFRFSSISPWSCIAVVKKI